MKLHTALAISSVLLIAGCSTRNFDNSTYVLIRYATDDESIPALRAYFANEGAQLNGISCREILLLVNEAVDSRIAKGETHLKRYQCVSLQEARERGF